MRRSYLPSADIVTFYCAVGTSVSVVHISISLGAVRCGAVRVGELSSCSSHGANSKISDDENDRRRHVAIEYQKS